MAPVRTPIRCAIYTRQSIESNADLSSCQVQFDLCSAFIQSRRSLGYELIEERFADEGYSGATLDRPALHRLLSHAVELDLLNAPETGAVALDRFMLNVLASFSEFERDLAATRIAESRAHLKAHGRRIAGATPFGYFADRHTKQLVVCVEEAAAVARMFQWADAGVTPAVIASFANALRWITGAGNPWTARQVLSILTNHTYAGLVVQGFAFR